MALPLETQEFGRMLAAEFAKVSQQQKHEILTELEKLLDAKLAETNARIGSLEKVMGGVVHEQRQQKHMLQKHAEQLARGDEEFKRLREEIHRQHELNLIALQSRGAGNALTVNGAVPHAPQNSVNVSNSPGVEAHQETAASNGFLRKAAAPATGAAVALALYEAMRRMMGGG